MLRRLFSMAILLLIAGAAGAQPRPPGAVTVKGGPMSLSVVLGAYGFGMDTRAAYGGGTSPAILRVTNLNDSGSGSLREALLTAGPRVVIFEISGTIILFSDIYVVDSYLTVAGQTAPSPGITLRGYSIWVYAHDVLFQHFRTRPGDMGAVDTGQGLRAGVYADGAYNIVADHLSVSWTNDEGTIVAKTNGGPGNSGTTDANVTFWRCLIAEGLNFTAREPASEGKGLAVNYNSKKVSAIQNLYVSTANRLPLVKGGTQVYFANNLVFNWNYNPPATFVDPVEDGTQTGPFHVSLIGNHYRTGPSWDPTSAYMSGSRYAQTGSELYLSDNLRDAVGGTLNEFLVINGDGIDPRVGSAPVTVTGYTPVAASAVQALLLPNVGARPLDRDSVDTRLVNDVTGRTGSSTLSSQGAVGGWPTLAVAVRALTVPSNPHTVTGSGYTNLEVWLQAYAAAVEGAGAVAGGALGTIPSGSLAFSGFGDAPMKFYSMTGVDLGVPASAPVEPGAGTDHMIAMLDTGRVVTIGGGSPNFPTTGIGIFNTDFTVHAEGASSAHHWASLGIGRDSAGRFYGGGVNGPVGPTPGQFYVFQYDQGGSKLADWAVVPAQDGTSAWQLRALGVSEDGLYAYFAAYDSLVVGSTPPTTVYAYDLAGSTALGVFKTETGYKIGSTGCVMSMGSAGDVFIGWKKTGGGAGYVKRYSRAGALLSTYTLPGTNSTPAYLTPGLTASSFIVSYYNDALATSSMVTVAEIAVSSGAILHSFNPDNGAFEFDGPLCVLRVSQGVTITPPPASPPGTVLCKTTSVLTSPSKTAGCNEGGVGWTPTYTGPSGTVPVGADPVDGETLSGKSGVHVWAETTHLTYPAETVETMRWAMTDLDDVTRKEGRLLSIGDTECGASDGQGNMSAGTLDIHISDLDGRPIGARLVDTTKKYFQRDEMAAFALSTTGRRTGATPRRIGRGLLQNLKYGTPAVVDFSAVDPFFCDGGAFGPDKKVPSWVYPNYYLNAPVDVYAKFMPIIIGEKSDEGAIDPVTNLPSSRGVCPLTFVGMDGLATGPGGTAENWGRFNVSLFADYACIGLYGADLGLYGIANAVSNGANPSVITLGGSPDLSGVVAQLAAAAASGVTDPNLVLTLWTGINLGVVTAQITAADNAAKTVTITATVAVGDTVGFATLAGPAPGVDWLIGAQPDRRVKIDLATRNGQDTMVWGYPNYIRSTTYEDIMGSDGETYRVQDVWIRGPLLDAHLNGWVTLAANVIGVEDRGDGTGLPLTDYFTAYNWFIENCILVNSKQPKGPGLLFPQFDSQLATYADGTYMVRGSSFVAAQAASAIGFGGDGLKVNAYFGEGISTRDAIQLWNDNGGCRTGINEHGQVFVWLLDRTADTTTWPRIEHVNRVFGQVDRDNPQTEIENVTQGSCDWEPDAQRYRAPLQQWPSATGIRHNKGIRKYSKSIDGKLTGDPLQWTYILQQRLAYNQDGPVYVTFTGDIGLLDYPVGSGIQFTSPMGPGATVGFVDEALIILTKRFHVDSHLVTLTCLDVGAGSGTDLMVDPDLVFTFGDESDPTPVLGDETAVPSTAMVLM